MDNYYKKIFKFPIKENKILTIDHKESNKYKNPN